MAEVTESLMRECFRQLDQDDDGLITADDILRVMRLRDQSTEAAEAHGLLQTMDMTGTGRVDFANFMMGVAELELDVSKLMIPSHGENFDSDDDDDEGNTGSTASPSAYGPSSDDNMLELQAAFESVSSPDGVVEPELLFTALRRHNSNATAEDAQDLLTVMGPDADGSVGFGGFVRAVRDLSLDPARFVGDDTFAGDERTAGVDSVELDEVASAASRAAAAAAGNVVLPRSRGTTREGNFDGRWRRPSDIASEGEDDEDDDNDGGGAVDSGDITDRAIQNAFDTYDTGEGTMPTLRLHDAMCDVDATATMQEAAELGRVIDRNGEGIVERRAFVRAMREWMARRAAVMEKESAAYEGAANAL